MNQLASLKTMSWFGIDVSKQRLDVHDLTHQQDYQFENTSAGIATLVKLLQTQPSPVYE